jgi:hypothetical protein
MASASREQIGRADVRTQRCRLKNLPALVEQGGDHGQENRAAHLGLFFVGVKFIELERRVLSRRPSFL